MYDYFITVFIQFIDERFQLKVSDGQNYSCLTKNMITRDSD